MLQSPFHKYHVNHNANFAEVGPWQMPAEYTSPAEEHQFVRNGIGLFDLSHLGRFKVAGRHARKLLERLLTRRVSDMTEHTCRLSLICNDQGGILDATIVYRFKDHWALVVNEASRQKIAQQIQDATGDFAVRVEDQTELTAMVAMQGPRVMDLIGKLSREVPSLKRYGFCIKNLLILQMTISRTGYTGEDGIEVILPAKTASMVLKLLSSESAGNAELAVNPCGLAARETLRIEAGLPAYGHELTEQIDPFTAGLRFAVDLDKGKAGPGPEELRFIGQDALERLAGGQPERKLVGLKLEGEEAATKAAAVMAAGKSIGNVTSACMSPTLSTSIAMAYINADQAEVGSAVTVESDSGQIAAQLVALPFYKRG